MYKTLHKKQGSVTVQLRFARSSVTFCAKRDSKVILAEKKETLLQSITELQKAVAYIDWKQRFYDDVLSGKTAYYSNLVPELLK